MAKLALRAEGHELELLAAVEGFVGEAGWEPVAAKLAISSEPTMMSQEARNLFLNGDKQSGLAAWKVGGAVGGLFRAGWRVGVRVGDGALAAPSAFMI